MYRSYDPIHILPETYADVLVLECEGPFGDDGQLRAPDDHGHLLLTVEDIYNPHLPKEEYKLLYYGHSAMYLPWHESKIGPYFCSVGYSNPLDAFRRGRNRWRIYCRDFNPVDGRVLINAIRYHRIH